MNPVLLSELQPADVLLMRGTAFVSDLIVDFDGGPYSHAAIFDGANVFEALERGCVLVPLVQSLTDHGARFVDVFRFDKDGHAIGDPGFAFDPIRAVINSYAAERERYAYEEILLLALLATARKLDDGSWGARLVADRAAAALLAITAGGRQPMICSELVFRCYFEAGPQYDLELANEPIDAITQTPLVAAYRASGPDEPVADFVTPGDLAKSRDLRLVGRLELPA
jgi:hypothetical protein